MAADSEVKLRLPAETKRRWKDEADRFGLPLGELIRARFEAQRGQPPRPQESARGADDLAAKFKPDPKGGR